MKQGYALGEDVDALIRRVRGTKAGGFTDGIMQASRREAEALVRSSVQTISNAAAMEGFKKLSDTIKGIEWLSTLDTRTTVICKALDGKVWTVPDLKPVGHDKVFPGVTAHWNCRSRQIPVLRSWDELAGKKINALDGQTLQERIAAKMAEKGADDQKIAAAVAHARASMDGQVSGSPAWDDWLKKKPDATVKATLGPGRAKLWQEGKLTVSDLTDQNNRPLTIAQLMAGINEGLIPVETEGASFQPFDKSLLKPYEKQGAAAAVQTAAKAKIDTVLANPKAVGNSIMSANLTKIQAAEPSLSPAELWAKAEEQTAAKIAANTKSSVLSKAKKKLVAGEPTTAAQQSLIDDLGDDEKAAFLEAVADAKAVKDGSAIKLKQEAAAIQKAKLKAEIDKQIANPAGSLLSEDLVEAFNTEGLTDEDVADLKSHLVAGVANKQAVDTLAEWAKDQTKQFAIDAAKKSIPDDASPADILSHAKFELKDIVATDVMTNGTAASKKAVKALTGMDSPTAQSVKAWMTKNGKDPETFLTEWQTLTKEKLDQSIKSSVLSKAKKKVAAGEEMTPGQMKVWQDLTSDEKHTFDDEVEAMKSKSTTEADKLAAIATSKKAADDAAKLAADAAAAKTAAESQTFATAAATAAKSAQATVPHPDDLTIIGNLGGTTGAKLAQDKAGNRYVVKRGAEADHVRVEMQADDLYRSMGLNVPEGALFETSGGPVKVTKFVEGGKPLSSFTGKEREKHFATLREDFVVDALMANWDVAGTGLDNVLVTPDGRVWRIDNGGSLKYRAQGDTTNKNWNRYPDELWSMRDQANIAGPIFGKLDIFEIADQIDGHDWDRLKNVPIDQATRDILDGRIEEMKRVAARAKDFGHGGYNARHTDGVARATIDIRQAGITTSMPAKLTTKSVPYQLEDANGREFGSLRTLKNFQTNAPIVQKVAGDIYSDDILIATKALASCSINGKDVSSGSAPGKMDKVAAMKPDLVALSKGTGETAQMAKTYLSQIDALEAIYKAGGKPANVPPNFAAATPAAVASKPVTPQNTTSVVKQWEALMAAEGIPTQAIQDWMTSQSGNSWSIKTQAMKVAFAKGFDDPQSFYWEGNSTKTSYATAETHFKAMAKATGGEDKLNRLVTSWHAMTQEMLSTIDAPWIDKKRRAVLLYRTVKPDEMAGSLVQPDKDGVFVPRRGTTESHSIYKTTNVLAQGPTAVTTVQAVPFSRVLATYWAEKPGATSGGGFLGDSEAEFAANTSGIKALKAGPKYKQPGYDEASKHAPSWGVPIDHLRP